VAAMAMMFEHSRVSIYLMPVVGSILVTVLYQASFQLVKDMEDPFGIGMDRLNPDIILDMAEKKIAAYLRKSSKCLPLVSLPSNRLDEKAIQEAAKALFEQEALEEATLEKEIEERSPSRKSTRPFRERIDSVDSGSAASDAAKATAEHERIRLPTSVVLSGVTLAKLAEGAHQDSKDLHQAVHEKLTRIETNLIQKLEEDDPYLVAVTELIAKLQQDSLSNAQLREQVISAVAGMSRVQDVVLENPSSRRLHRSKDPLSARRKVVESSNEQIIASARTLQ